MLLQDLDTERALLSNLVHYGLESYHEVCTLGLSPDTFTLDDHKIIYSSLEYLFEEESVKRVDMPLLLSASKTLNYDDWFVSNNVQEYIEDHITNIETKLESGPKYAKKLRKLEVANNIDRAAREIQTEISEVDGSEKLSDIFSIAESKLSDLSSFLTDTAEDPMDLGREVMDHLDALENNPVDQLGIPTGFPLYDKYIGGGLRKHAIHVVAARPKVGKSTFCKNVAVNVAKEGIPVLYLDTEMESLDQLNRLVASESETPIHLIESGKFAESSLARQNVSEAAKSISGIQFKHKNIAGMGIEAQLAIARKWIIKDVGLDKDGLAKDCLLVYDYIKVMDSKELSKYQEYQALGFLMTSLQNFAVRYDIPILTAAQLNRDGIEKSDTSAISASDRIAMYCSSITILKNKSHEEMAAENHTHGNQKLMPLIARYGEAMHDGDFINLLFQKDCNKMLEKGMRQDAQKKVTEEVIEQ